MPVVSSKPTWKDVVAEQERERAEKLARLKTQRETASPGDFKQELLSNEPLYPSFEWERERNYKLPNKMPQDRRNRFAGDPFWKSMGSANK